MVEITGTELVALEQRAHTGNLTKKDVRKIFALIVQQQALIEQQAAEIARLKLLCEKKTIENCKVIKQSFREGVGRPEMIDGKCEGYAISDWDDEPHDSCKECIAGMESEEAWLQEMEGRR